MEFPSLSLLISIPQSLTNTNFSKIRQTYNSIKPSHIIKKNPQIKLFTNLKQDNSQFNQTLSYIKKSSN